MIWTLRILSIIAFARNSTEDPLDGMAIGIVG